MPILVDLDGTLFDTFEAHYKSYKEVLADYGFFLHEELFRQECFGHSSRVFLSGLGFDINACKEIISKKRASFPRHLSEIAIHVGLHDFLHNMKGQDHIALFTNAQRETVDLLFSHFGISNLFDSIHTIEDFLISKPSHESFQFVLKQIPKGEVFLIDDMQENLLKSRNFGVIPIDVNQIVHGFSLTPKGP
jgi:FMN phosphatase YigB (HAD superfamily)